MLVTDVVKMKYYKHYNYNVLDEDKYKDKH